MNTDTPPTGKTALSMSDLGTLLVWIMPVIILWGVTVNLSYRWFVAPLVASWPETLSMRASCGLAVIIVTLRGGGRVRKNERPWRIIAETIGLQAFRIGVICVAHLLIGQVR